MQSIQLFIEGERVDMFKDESVSITQSIQNVKDIAKVFTEFTKTFTLPASKANNKIFKHYYNFDITGGFDARTKKSATLELNNLPFKKGKIKLNGVDLKNRRPKSYRVTFFGNTVTLKDLLGEDKLSALSELNKYNHVFAKDDIKRSLQRDQSTLTTGTVDSISGVSIQDSSGFGSVSVGDLITNTTTNESTYITGVPVSTTLTLNEQIFTASDGYEVSNHILAPIITHTKRLFYDSNGNDDNTGNLHYDSGEKHGLAWNELKYALRVHEIIKAIEDRYSITFSTDFFNTTNDVYHDLYMWLHRKKGVVSSGSQVPVFTNLINGWTVGTGTTTPSGRTNSSKMVSTSVLEITNNNLTALQLNLQRSTTTPYDVKMVVDGFLVVASATNVTSTNLTLTSSSLFSTVITTGRQVTATLTYESALSFTDIIWSTQYLQSAVTVVTTHSTGSYTANTEFEFAITEQIPEMKVIDFLTGVFKMFNLTSFVEDDGTIYVDTLDNFYTNKKSISTAYDISEFVDVNKSQVNVALPYREVSFSFEDTKTFLAATHNQLFGQEWGKTDFTETDDNNNIVDGGLYSVKAPFGHAKYERLLDLNSSAQTGIQWGFSVDDNQESYIGKPLLFYPVYTNPTQSISFIEFVDSDGNYDNEVEITGSVNMPSNSLSFSSGTSTANINFSLEVNEYTGDNTFTGTLFENYYKTYIQSVFNTKNRITKVKAYLPLRILLNFTLADRFDINGKRYKINSINTNLKTGESNIELLNEL